MKSNNMLIGISILILALAVTASIFVWDEVSSAVKIGMFAFGFSSGVIAGVLILRRQKSLS
jgi:hypothetical protein